MHITELNACALADEIIISECPYYHLRRRYTLMCRRSVKLNWILNKWQATECLIRVSSRWISWNATSIINIMFQFCETPWTSSNLTRNGHCMCVLFENNNCQALGLSRSCLHMKLNSYGKGSEFLCWTNLSVVETCIAGQGDHVLASWSISFPYCLWALMS